MQDFYRGLRGGRDKAQALRMAMLGTMATYPNPADWAAFELIGETSNAEGLLGVTGSAPVLARGDDKSDASGLAEQIVLPGQVRDYREVTGTDSRASASFDSPLPIADLLTFYRNAYSRRGFTEDTALANLDKKGGHIVMRADGRKLIVQITDMSNLTTDSSARRTVSIRFEQSP